VQEIVVDAHTLFFAFKYALGRKSAAPSIVMTAIIKNMEKLSDVELRRYIKEIEECKDYGLDTDKENWLSLKKDLEAELEFRNRKY